MIIGPIIRGDKSVLEHDLTHATSGLPLYPAFDTGWRNGDVVIAPERVTVTRHSGGPHSGFSIYLDGESGLKYYVTHLNLWRTPVGKTVPQGEQLSTVGSFVGARVPHAHVGINAEKIIGEGKELKHNTNYTHGAPTVGKQLALFLRPKPPWPVPIPKWFWEWMIWKDQGQPWPRPASAPRIIPLWAWRRRAALLKARK